MTGDGTARLTPLERNGAFLTRLRGTSIGSRASGRFVSASLPPAGSDTESDYHGAIDENDDEHDG